MSFAGVKPILFFPPTGPDGVAAKYGFRVGDKGTHSSRTLMLSELEAVLAATTENVNRAIYASAIIEGNCLSKPTASTRRLSNQRLGELYALDPFSAVFRVLRKLWSVDAAAHPLLAMLAALARDPLFMASASPILSLPVGAELQRAPVRGALRTVVGERLNDAVLDKVVRNVAATATRCVIPAHGTKASEFLNTLFALARATGGDPPLPPLPSVTDIEDLQARVGNEQLAGIREKAPDLEKQIEEWTRTKALVEARKPIWAILERLVRHADGLPSAEEHLKQVDAVRSHRLLLEPTDPVSPLRSAIADVLRKALLDAHTAHEKAHLAGVTALDGNPLWQRLSSENRTSIMTNVGLIPPTVADVSSNTSLLVALDVRPLSARRTEADAVPGRVQRALEQAARLLELTVRPISVERATLTTEADVQQWVQRQ
jgi:hypothetical protein